MRKVIVMPQTHDNTLTFLWFVTKDLGNAYSLEIWTKVTDAQDPEKFTYELKQLPNLINYI